ncbi:hypothetical protein PR202_gb06145 [Eleusine coracana subsp. coracana]|uniref:Uncharacterized protein n=1 Tax=Eleusine coracana subsp. coracana TaxID=191504 RepID=A0AAV5E855_ELECO|nr:hypothetical protein PR202_gb06145 [Eleusine coracana subsp. coracana]
MIGFGCCLLREGANCDFQGTLDMELFTEYGEASRYQIQEIHSEKARGYLADMPKKHPIPFSHKFQNADPLALRLLEHLLAFDPKDRPTAEEALADPYFRGLAKLELEPSAQPPSNLDFEFERRKQTKDDLREMIYREILEYHPQMLREYIEGGEHISFLYPSGVDRFKRQFAHLEENYSSGVINRERVCSPKDGNNHDACNEEGRATSSVALTTISPPRSKDSQKHESVYQEDTKNSNFSAKSYPKIAASIGASKCVAKRNKYPKDMMKEEAVTRMLT